MWRFAGSSENGSKSGSVVVATTAATYPAGAGAVSSSSPSNHRSNSNHNHNNTNNTSTKDLVILHGKRVSQILRYISTLQTSSSGQYSFVRNVREHSEPFYADNGNNTTTNNNNGNNHSVSHNVEAAEEYDGSVLFTTYDFQKLASLASQETLPFSFYTTKPTNNHHHAQNKQSRKRTSWGSPKNNGTNHHKSSSSSSRNPNNNNNNNTLSSSCCWLRITRITSQVTKPSMDHPKVQAYLKEWGKFLKINSAKKLLTLQNLEHPPPTSSARVERFVRQYQRYLQHKHLQRRLEPIYNGLFEWFHGGNNELDLIWGMGQATVEDGNGNLVDGPLLEVKVEVELARDGALLVRPKQYAGVTWNRSVLNSLLQTSDTATIKKWNQLVEALDPCQDINPAEPSTYIPLLKQMAVECCSGGTFIPSSGSPSQRAAAVNNNKLVVTDAWCLYASPRPSAVWARDALAFCENPAAHLPRALWALTHGPGAVWAETEQQAAGRKPDPSWSFGMFRKQPPGPAPREKGDPYKNTVAHLHFPLPTSEAQNRIAALLLTKNYPAVVCEGPPGTGKTHTIANIVCAYLCQGKRVLVTSKGAPALSVLRERLPPCVQELCVDVSMSESVGMRQLQQTVERLANKVSWVQTDREQRRGQALQDEIQALKEELQTINQRLRQNAELKRALVQTQDGQDLFETSLGLIESVPWLMKTIASWDLQQVTKLANRLKEVVADPKNDPIHQVSGLPTVPSEALISLAESHAGVGQAYVKNMAKGVLASLPWLGSRMSQHCSEIQAELHNIRINGSLPSAIDDWKLVVRALEKERNAQLCWTQFLDPLIKREGWPVEFFLGKSSSKKRRRVKADVVSKLEAAATVKKLEGKLETNEQVKDVEDFVALDARRIAVSSRIQHLSEDLVACKVVAELSMNFTAEAQSALVKFAQVSGKAKFGKSASQQKMSQRQRRKRQEYLDAFEKCVRYIPCWILTSSQISNYLPAECLFDLVVIDEASQSDISVLPGLLRGKQWLIVGDGKQVSPTETFVAEEQIEMLKSALPDSPFESSMLPGHSFFDLCSQAYPMGRVILREHFRCAPEIISYSNAEFYNGNLVPLRLPTKDERLNPSLIDVRLPNGRKVGKVNPQECNEIVRMIQEYVESCTLLKKRSIGVISLVGEEQSRLIRGRLLDNIGPHKYKLHDILVGEPPSFQGAERDIVFLSLVCSPGSMVAQNQLMHAQRANVALSRARDRMVLVRSFDTNHISNDQDIKFSVLDFFERSRLNDGATGQATRDVGNFGARRALSPFRFRAENVLKRLLEERGFCTRPMGVVWENAICVEDSVDSAARAAICIEATGENEEEWACILEQQKSIERVGWKCLRVDGSSFLADHFNVLCSIETFLASVGVHSTRAAVELAVEESDSDSEESEDEIKIDGLENHVGDVYDQPEQPPEQLPCGGGRPDPRSHADDHPDPVRPVLAERHPEPNIDEVAALPARAEAPALPARAEAEASEEEVVVVSSDDEEKMDVDDEMNLVPVPILSLGNGETAEDYGNIADLGFLRRADSLSFSGGRKPKVARSAKRRGAAAPDSPPNSDDDLKEKQRAVANSTKETFDFDDLSESSCSDVGFDNGSAATQSRSSRHSRRKRTRLDRHAKDARWYPSRKKSDHDEDVSYEEYMGEVVPEQARDKKNMDQDDCSVDDREEEKVQHGDDDPSYVDEQEIH